MGMTRVEADNCYLVSLLLFVALLLWRVDAQSTQCLRWNCPCSGSKRMLHHVQNKRFHLISGHAQLKTRKILERVINERFRENEQHVKALEECVKQRGQACIRRLLSRDCSLLNLPVVENNTGSMSDANVEQLIRRSRALLAGVAEFVEQARLDENTHVTDARYSLDADIRHLEEKGLYDLLCKLHIEYTRRQMPWQAGEIARQRNLAECRDATDRAVIDNRNYMVFYTLDSILGHLTDRFRALESSQLQSSSLHTPAIRLLQVR